jgi:hypothetical protein
MATTDEGLLLADHPRRVHRALIDAALTTGNVPSAPELADRLGSSPEAIREALRVLAAADYLALDADGQVTGLYPFSATPTSHVVVIDGQRRFAMCAIDALGVPAMLAAEIAIEGRCAVCDASIALRVRRGAVVSATPPEAMVVARRDEAEPAFAACCPYTVFVCSQEHAEQFARRIAGAHTLTLAEALRHGEKIFAGLLAEDLPANRPRGKSWGPSRDA